MTKETSKGISAKSKISVAANKYFAKDRNPFVHGLDYWRKITKHREFEEICEDLAVFLDEGRKLPEGIVIPAANEQEEKLNYLFFYLTSSIGIAHQNFIIAESYGKNKQKQLLFSKARKGINECVKALKVVRRHTGYDVPGHKPREFLEIGMEAYMDLLKEDIRQNLKKIDHYFKLEMQDAASDIATTKDAHGRPLREGSGNAVFVRHLGQRFETYFGITNDSLVRRITEAVLVLKENTLTTARVTEQRTRWNPNIDYR